MSAVKSLSSVSGILRLPPRSGSRYIVCHACFAVFNVVVFPCLAAAVASPLCFKSAIASPPPVLADYTIPFCSNYNADNICIQHKKDLFTTSFLPPFQYSYQCSSIIITKFAPVYVNMYMISTFLLPIMENPFVLLQSRLGVPVERQWRLHFYKRRFWVSIMTSFLVLLSVLSCA